MNKSILILFAYFRYVENNPRRFQRLNRQTSETLSHTKFKHKNDAL